MKEQEVKLKAYRREVEILSLTMDVPYYDDHDKRSICGTYESTLLKLFNNKRDNKEILDIRNYYNNNKITMVIDFTTYMSDSYESKEEAIEHLKNWFAGMHDIKRDDIVATLDKGYIYEVDELDNDMEGIYNYVVQTY